MEKDLDENSEEVEDGAGKLKTYGDLKNDYEKFTSLCKDKKKAKECHSTVNLTLFEENNHIYVIEKCVIPELHILQGFVNHRGIYKLNVNLVSTINCRISESIWP